MEKKILFTCGFALFIGYQPHFSSSKDLHFIIYRIAIEPIKARGYATYFFILFGLLVKIFWRQPLTERSSIFQDPVQLPGSFETALRGNMVQCVVRIIEQRCCFFQT